MKLKNAAVLLIFALLLSVTTAFAQEGTIVDIAAGNEDFSTLVELVTAAGLADTLAGEGTFTVFAPTNDAFAALGEDVLAYLASDTALLTRVLTYHVLPVEVMSADVTTGMVATVEGGELNIVVDDMGVHVNDSTVTAADIDASNGVIHVIDAVLVPSIELEPVIPAEVQGNVATAGSSTVFPLSQAVVAAFKDEGYTGEIAVDSVGTGGGFDRFCATGESDVANASRPINQEEIDECAALATPRAPIEFRVGTDALAVVVNPANDFVENVTVEELALIFGGAEFWSDVNADWPDEPILRFIPGTDSGTFDYFVEEVFDEDPEPIQQSYGASTAQLSEDDNILLEGVANNTYAIGFFGYAYYSQEQDAVKILSIEGVEPNIDTTESGEYPLARPLFIYSDAAIIAEKPQVGQYISYYLSNVNELIGEVGYFPASDAAINKAKLALLAAIHAGM